MIRKAWTSKGRFSYDGRWWHYDNIVVEPAPIQQPHPPLWLGAGSAELIRRAAREGYNLLLDQIAPIDLIIERVRIFREECESVGRAYDPMMVGVTRGLQIVHNEEERKRAILTRREVLKNIGDLARGPDAERYHQIKDDPDTFELDDAPLLGTPEEIIAPAEAARGRRRPQRAVRRARRLDRRPAHLCRGDHAGLRGEPDGAGAGVTRAPRSALASIEPPHPLQRDGLLVVVGFVFDRALALGDRRVE